MSSSYELWTPQRSTQRAAVRHDGERQNATLVGGLPVGAAAAASAFLHRRAGGNRTEVDSVQRAPPPACKPAELDGLSRG